jgi:ATP-dependent exoDNAse (exonuclease V) beta subunit
MKSLDTPVKLNKYLKSTQDNTMKMLTKIVETHRTNTPSLMKQLSDMVVEDKDKADYIFTTVHKSKGLEYSVVEVLDDFISEEYIKEQVKLSEKEDSNVDFDLINENINCKYTAYTRAVSKLILN